MDCLLRDIRDSCRHLIHNPRLSLMATGTLGLGIGVMVVVAAILDGVLLHPLAVERPEQLMAISASDTSADEHFSAGDVALLHDGLRGYLDVAGYSVTAKEVTVAGQQFIAANIEVTPEFFSILAAQPENDSVGALGIADHTTVLSGINTSKSANLLGSSLKVGSDYYEVRGILSPRSAVPLFIGPCFYTLIEKLNPVSTHETVGRSFGVVARLRPGVSFTTAAAALDAFTKHQKLAFLSTGTKAMLFRYDGLVTRKEKPALTMLTVACLSLLFIATVNAVIIQTVLATSRNHSLAVRMLLGASRARLISLAIVESMLLALAAGAGAAVVATLLWRSLAMNLGSEFPALSCITMNLRIAGLGIATIAVCAMSVAILPVLDILRGERCANHTIATTRLLAAGRATSLAVVFQIAFSCIVIMAGWTFFLTFLHLSSFPLGFEKASVSSISLDAPEESLPVGVILGQYSAITGELQGRAGVKSAAYASALPFSPYQQELVWDIPNPRAGTGSTVTVATDIVIVDQDIRLALVLRLLQGEWFNSEDLGGKPVALVNETLAKMFYGSDRTSLHKQIDLGSDMGFAVPLEVKGVVGDVAMNRLSVFAPRPTLYLLSAQMQMAKTGASVLLAGSPAFALRSSLPATEIYNLVHRTIQDTVPARHVLSIDSMDTEVDRAFSFERIAMISSTLLASVSLLLALSGLYAVSSAQVAARQRDLALRIALGASKESIVADVYSRAVRIYAVGLFMGSMGFINLRSELTTFAPGVERLSWIALTVALLLVTLACMASILGLALRAGAVDPLAVLKG
jgi:putative ABC transport system permease protein